MSPESASPAVPGRRFRLQRRQKHAGAEDQEHQSGIPARRFMPRVVGNPEQEDDEAGEDPSRRTPVAMAPAIRFAAEVMRAMRRRACALP